MTIATISGQRFTEVPLSVALPLRQSSVDTLVAKQPMGVTVTDRPPASTVHGRTRRRTVIPRNRRPQPRRSQVDGSGTVAGARLATDATSPASPVTVAVPGRKAVASVTISTQNDLPPGAIFGKLNPTVVPSALTSASLG